MNNLTPTQRVEKAHVQMMGHKATMLYSGVFMVGNTQVKDGIPTAYTNGRDTFYGSAFVEKQTPQTLNGLILHENLHKVYQHHWLWKHLWKENPRMANMAADYVINLEIVDLAQSYPDFIKLPEGALIDESFRGMNTQEVFEKLKEKGGDNGGGGGQGDADADGSGGSEGVFDEHDFTELTEAEREAVTKEVEQAIRQGQLLAGKNGADVSRAIKELLTPQVRWEDQLRDFMTETCSGKDNSTWRRPNKRWLQHDIYLPTSISESMGCMVIVRDTSGSVDEVLASIFLTEVVALCETVRPSLVHLLDVDADVQRHLVFAPEEFGKLREIRDFIGGGGTDMRKAFEYAKDKNLNPEAVLVLTDGYTPFPTETSVPSLWAITTDIQSPVGVTIHVNDRR